MARAPPTCWRRWRPYVDVEPEEEEAFDESYGDKRWVAAPAAVDDEDSEYNDPNKPLRVTIIGRPNAGKSTLVNRMIGEERLLTGPEAGITRDTISVD